MYRERKEEEFVEMEGELEIGREEMYPLGFFSFCSLFEFLLVAAKFFNNSYQRELKI